MEKWKKHPQFKNYEVSDRGRVRSLPRMVRSKAGSLRLSPGKLLDTAPKADGYAEVALYVEGKQYYKRVCRLVLETFNGDGAGKVCRHLDGNQRRDALSNLKWGTHKENSEDMIKHGRSTTGAKNGMNLHPESRSPGEKNGSAKLCVAHVERIRELRSAGAFYSDIATHIGISKSQVFRICTGASWR